MSEESLLIGYYVVWRCIFIILLLGRCIFSFLFDNIYVKLGRYFLRGGNRVIELIGKNVE